MVKFYGKIGYGTPVDRQNGIWSDEITERAYFGDIVQNNRRFVEGDQVNANLSISTSISIVADDYIRNNAFAIRYVEWEGALWTVDKIEPQSPRLILRLGGVYNGPRPS